jgi:PPOX class probable F420-dependent enzyme
MRIEGWARRLLERPLSFATLATSSPDGSPLQSVVWYTLRDDSVLVNSRVGRRWPSNLLRDARYSFLVEHGYDWVSLRGHAEALADPEGAQEDIAAMARRYHVADPARAARSIDDFRRQERISFLLHVDAISEHRDD